MNTLKSQYDLLMVIANAFLWCFILSLGLLLFWFGVYLVLGDFAYYIHSRMFDLSEHEFTLMNYYGMGLVKLCGILFFLAPYLGIRLALRGKG